ncbi:Dxo1p KNAG_0C04890 [Huiozyma naganishii CBS 8797]|uniref:Decapping nuclease n=1 Tax=Huiozyma naganishii (strain ATCC MYA-139 / BCRC 22969 / CBS 8797 / KCTC 17520 / NBRC 10181 / NCYC 3082 / Yp74L-3) TaxID=1071383 RepID=J7R425_HUIN7|nr:hypothetical protein KNAG_0C04890 [Kazachstania naganishii CBS 8797]CCK69590.1 hypothetical protein KNAG_0C04890 [Kazachstania naganishii CBS 8797]
MGTMTTAIETDDLLNSFHRLSINDQKRVRFKEFHHHDPGKYVSKPAHIFQKSKEVACYTGGKLYINDGNTTNLTILPLLKEDIAALAQSKNTQKSGSFKSKYLGLSLYAGFEDYVFTMSPDMLDSAKPCLDYINEWNRGSKGEKKFGESYRHIIVGPRHHLVELTMALFANDSDYKLVCTVLRGKFIVLSQFDDGSQRNRNEGITLSDRRTRMLCYSGFVICKIWSLNRGIIPSQFFYYGTPIRRGHLATFTCEMDAYNQIENHYTELKCYGPLNMKSSYHKSKLLRTWVQTEVSPDTDVVIGCRNAYDGTLQDITQLSRESLYRKFNNKHQPRAHTNFNYNAQVAVEWSQYAMKAIIRLIEGNLNQKSVLEPQAFVVTVYRGHDIGIRKLKGVPKYAEIPKEFI